MSGTSEANATSRDHADTGNDEGTSVPAASGSKRTRTSAKKERAQKRAAQPRGAKRTRFLAQPAPSTASVDDPSAQDAMVTDSQPVSSSDDPVLVQELKTDHPNVNSDHAMASIDPQAAPPHTPALSAHKGKRARVTTPSTQKAATADAAFLAQSHLISQAASVTKPGRSRKLGTVAPVNMTEAELTAIAPQRVTLRGDEVCTTLWLLSQAHISLLDGLPL